MAFQVRYIITPRLFGSFVRQMSRNEGWNLEFSNITRAILSRPPPSISLHFNDYYSNLLRVDGRLGALWEGLMLNISSVNQDYVPQTDDTFPNPLVSVPLVPLIDWSTMSRSEASALERILLEIENDYLTALNGLSRDFAYSEGTREAGIWTEAVRLKCCRQGRRVHYWALFGLRMALRYSKTDFMPERAVRVQPVQVAVVRGFKALQSFLRSLFEALSF